MKPADITDYDMLTFRMVQCVQRATNALTAAESEACQREADRLDRQRKATQGHATDKCRRCGRNTIPGGDYCPRCDGFDLIASPGDGEEVAE